MPTGAERYRSSVGGALELSETGARPWRSADLSCEHPVGGPCVSGPMKVRHADRRSAGDKGGFVPADQTDTALAVLLANMVHSQGCPPSVSCAATRWARVSHRSPVSTRSSRWPARSLVSNNQAGRVRPSPTKEKTHSP